MNSYGQPSSTGADIAAAKLSGNISTHDTSQQIALGLSESSREAQLKQKEILRRVELEKKVCVIAVMVGDGWGGGGNVNGQYVDFRASYMICHCVCWATLAFQKQ